MVRTVANTLMSRRLLIFGAALLTLGTMVACGATENTDTCKEGEILNEHGVCVPYTPPAT